MPENGTWGGLWYTEEEQSHWPKDRFGLWAPGRYMCVCGVCNIHFLGDKRSLHCGKCAMEQRLSAVINNLGAGI